MKILQTRKDIAYITLATLVLSMLLLQVVGMVIESDAYIVISFIDGGSRVLGGLFFLVLLYHLGYSFLSHSAPLKSSLIIVLPGLVIALNNFPLIAYLNDQTTMIAPTFYVVPFILETFTIGFFEEIVFRAVILLVLLERFEEDKHGILKSVIISSAVFGLIHVLNFFSGAGLFETIQQVGYSFLMGLLWAVVYLKTRNLWLAMGLHAIYNITGSFFVVLGTVRGRFDWITIVVTTLFAVLGAIYYYNVLQTVKVEDLQPLYKHEA